VKKIYKYELDIVDTQEIFMPIIYRTLSVDVQYEKVCIWALVNIDEPLFPRTFHIYGTGNSTPKNIDTFKFVGTAQMAGGALVWHVFEERIKEI